MDCKDIGITKSKFVAKTQFLCWIKKGCQVSRPYFWEHGNWL